MKNGPASIALLCAVCGLAIQSHAQQAPGPERRPEPRDQRPNNAPDGARPEASREGGPGRGDGSGPVRADLSGKPRLPDGVTPDMLRRYMELRGQLGQGPGQLDAMRNYLDVFDRYSRLSRDPSAAGVAAVVSAGEILRARGADTAIAYFNKVMPEVKNDAVKRAIRLQLVELYKMSGQQDKALEQLQSLMISAPPGGPKMGTMEDGEGGGRPKPKE